MNNVTLPSIDRPRRFSAPDVALASTAICAIIGLWYAGDFHTRHYSDTAAAALLSLYRWTPFFWEYDHVGMLPPLLVSFVRRPFLNLLAMTALSTFFLLGGLTMWVYLVSPRKTALTESALWVMLFVPVVMPKELVFPNAAFNCPWGTAFFFSGLFALALVRFSEAERRRAWLLALAVFAFLGTYAAKTAFIPLTIVTLGLFWEKLRGAAKIVTQSGEGGRRVKLVLDAPVWWLGPLAALALAFAAYEILEWTSPFRSNFAPGVSDVTTALPRLLKQWAETELTTPWLALVPLPFLLYKPTARHRNNPLLTYLAAGVLVEALTISSTLWAVHNAPYAGAYLTDLTFLLIVLLSSSAAAIRQSIPSATLRKTILAAAAAGSLYANAIEWNSYPPANPLSAMEQTLGADTAAIAAAECDIVAGNYWQVWTAVLAADDYYYRRGVIDSRTGKLRTVDGLAYRAWPTESSWRPRLAWPDFKLCAFEDDTAGMREAVGTYTPEIALTLTRRGHVGRLNVYEVQPKVMSEVSLDFDSAVPGSGWSLPEVGPNGETFQWMNAVEATILLPLATDRDVGIEFRILHIMAPDILESLTLSANSQQIALARMPVSGASAAFRGTIPQPILAMGRSATTLEFRIDRTVVPALVIADSQDARSLGVAFDWLRIAPAP